MTFSGAGVDIFTVDPDCWRADETQPLRRLVAGHIDQAKLGLDAELAAHPLDQRPSTLVIRTTIEVENLNERVRHHAHCAQGSQRNPSADHRYTSAHTRTDMEHLWSQAGATRGNRLQVTRG